MKDDKNLSINDFDNFVNEIRNIIDESRRTAVRSVDFCRVQMYWHIGNRIVEKEQEGNERAEYGKRLLNELAKRIVPEYGSGFSYCQLYFCRQFYLTYPILNALRSEFNWTQYRKLIQISDPCKREYYELEAANNCWTNRRMAKYKRLKFRKFKFQFIGQSIFYLQGPQEIYKPCRE